jgi:hypothetical protein
MLVCDMLKEPILIGTDELLIKRDGAPSQRYSLLYERWCAALAEEHVRTWEDCGPKSQLLIEIQKRHGVDRMRARHVLRWQRTMLERAEKLAWERARCL